MTTYLPYDGTHGFVRGSDTSRDRAMREIASGAVTERQKSVLQILEARPEGLTWQELGLILGLHHGQISGVLSVLHKVGAVAHLTDKRNRCHPYIAASHIPIYPAERVVLEPSQTKSAERKKLVDEVVAAARAVDRDWTLDSAAHLRQALNRLDAIAGT